jgi:predicted permease
MLAVFLAAVALVLLVACANLANLLLARSATRSREVAIRIALGATRWRVVRQLLVECLLIALLAGIGGALLSLYGARAIAVGFDVIEATAPSAAARPFWVDLSLDGLTLAFVGLLCVFATLACGLVPALHLARTGVNDVLKDTAGGAGGGTRRWAGAFVVAELAFTLMLLSAAGHLWGGFIAAYTRDTVIDTADLMTMRFTLAGEKYATGADRTRFLQALEDRLSELSVLSSATLASAPPFDVGGPARAVSLDGRDAQPGQTLPLASYVQTGVRYFETVRLPLSRGRALTAADGRAGQEGAVVDERFVSALLGGEDPIGRRVRLTMPAPSEANEPRWFTIVGVARTLPPAGPPPLVRPVVYVPMEAEPSPERAAAMLVRDPAGLAAVVPVLREEVRRLDPDVAVYAIETMDAIVARQRYGARLLGTWSGVIAGIALLMASVGLYALTAHAVAQRGREIGLRMALGARPAQVVGLFLRRAVVQLVLGLGIGTAGALAASRILQGVLSDTGGGDPVTLASVAALLIVVSLTASILPARRAARMDPVSALRAE